MAAKKNDKAFDDFLADLKTINPKIEELIADESVKTKLREGVLARSEFSSQMDNLRVEREAFGHEVTEARKKIDGWTSWYGTASQEYANQKEQLEAYKEEYGELTTGQKHREAAKVGLTTEEFEAKLNSKIQEHDVAALKFMDHLSDIKIEHRDRFKERLDTAKVFEIAGEKNLPLDAAYKEYIADRVEEQRTKDIEERIKQAKEEGAREALAAKGFPVISNNSDLTHVLDIKDAPRTSNDRIAAAVAAFNTKR